MLKHRLGLAICVRVACAVGRFAADHVVAASLMRSRWRGVGPRFGYQ
jgi:hypothetical protein